MRKKYIFNYLKFNNVQMNKFLTKARNSDGIKSFNSLTIGESRLVLRNKEKDKFIIFFAELNKIFIKKRQLSIFFKIGIIGLSLFFLAILENYFSLGLVLVVGLFLVLPFFVWSNNYKWYQLIILHHDGTFFIKTFYKKEKQEQINLVNVVKKEVINNNTMSDSSNGIFTSPKLTVIKNLLPTTSIKDE